jgi:hypothetical protein
MSEGLNSQVNWSRTWMVWPLKFRPNGALNSWKLASRCTFGRKVPFD